MHVFIAELVSGSLIYSPLVSSLLSQEREDWRLLVFHDEPKPEVIDPNKPTPYELYGKQIEFMQEPRFELHHITPSGEDPIATARRAITRYCRDSKKFTAHYITHCDTETYYAPNFLDYIDEVFEHPYRFASGLQNVTYVVSGYSSGLHGHQPTIYESFTDKTPVSALDMRAVSVSAEFAYRIGFPATNNEWGHEFCRLVWGKGGEQNFVLNKVLAIF